MLPLGSVLGEDAVLQTSISQPYLYTASTTTMLFRALHIEPKHTWISQKSIQFLTSARNTRILPAGTNWDIFLCNSQMAIRGSLTGFHSETAFGSTAYRLKNPNIWSQFIQVLSHVPLSQFQYSKPIFFHANFSL